MDIILATKSTTPIIGQLATLMGWIMNGIYKMFDSLFGIQNLGLCIIIFSIVIFLFMTPLQVKQQKFSKLSAVMQPELQKIQKKYQGKRDQDAGRNTGCLPEIRRFSYRKLCAVVDPVSCIDGFMAGYL